jgi:hypothetical protein
MTHDWVIYKEGKKWNLSSRATLYDGTTSDWSLVGLYKTRRSAITVGMLMRDRVEKISWPGGSIQIGIATVASC